jgi:hypothetical protein
MEIEIKEVHMKGKYSRWIGGLGLATLMLAGIAFFSPGSVQAQTRQRRIVVVRPLPYRIYRPFGFRRYDPFNRYNSYYSQYVFSNGESAANQGYKDGFKTGQKDGKKNKSFDPERSHYYHDSGFGNFAEVYRSGFSRGYQDGYRDGSGGIG